MAQEQKAQRKSTAGHVTVPVYQFVHQRSIQVEGPIYYYPTTMNRNQIDPNVANARESWEPGNPALPIFYAFARPEAGTLAIYQYKAGKRDSTYRFYYSVDSDPAHAPGWIQDPQGKPVFYLFPELSSGGPPPEANNYDIVPIFQCDADISDGRKFYYPESNTLPRPGEGWTISPHPFFYALLQP